MGLMNNGVAGGVAVTGQTSGVTMTLASDYAAMTLSQASPPAGPDATGRITVTASGPGASVTIQKLFLGADPTVSANWTTLSGVIRSDTNAFVNSAVLLSSGVPLDFNLGNVQGLGVVRVLLNIAPSSGSVLAVGSAFPGTVTGTEAGILQALTALLTTNQLQLLALQELTGTQDYTGGV